MPYIKLIKPTLILRRTIPLPIGSVLHCEDWRAKQHVDDGDAEYITDAEATALAAVQPPAPKIDKDDEAPAPEYKDGPLVEKDKTIKPSTK